MSFSAPAAASIGVTEVITTNGRGMNPDELTALAMRKILHIGDTAPPVIRDQALVFHDRIESVVRHYIAQAQRSERTTISNLLENAGQHDAAELLRKL